MSTTSQQVRGSTPPRNGQRYVITVDGLAGSGKTTLARLLAEKMHFVHLNSGLLYRAVALLCLKSNTNVNDGPAIVGMLHSHTLELKAGSLHSVARMIIDGENRTNELSPPEVSEATSLSARHAEVRGYLIEAQRTAFSGHNVVAEGRDMGTVIFPHADLKFFVVASEEVRVQRRIQQLYANKPLEQDLNLLKRKLEIEISERDKRDSTRAVAPTVAAEDAQIVDNSTQTLTDVVQSMYDAASSRGLLPK